MAFYAVVCTVSSDPGGDTTVVVETKGSSYFNPFDNGQKVPFTLNVNESACCMTCEFSHPDHVVSSENIAEIRAVNKKKSNTKEYPLVEPRKLLGEMLYRIDLNEPRTKLFYLLAEGELKHLPLTIVPVIVDYVFIKYREMYWVDMSRTL